MYHLDFCEFSSLSVAELFSILQGSFQNSSHLYLVQVNLHRSLSAQIKYRQFFSFL